MDRFSTSSMSLSAYVRAVGSSSPTGSATSIPPAIMKLPSGTVLKGVISRRTPQGDLIFSSPRGDIVLKTNIFIKAGTEVSIRLENAVDGFMAKLITIGGKSAGKYLESLLPKPPQDGVSIRNSAYQPVVDGGVAGSSGRGGGTTAAAAAANAGGGGEFNSNTLMRAFLLPFSGSSSDAVLRQSALSGLPDDIAGEILRNSSTGVQLSVRIASVTIVDDISAHHGGVSATQNIAVKSIIAQQNQQAQHALHDMLLEGDSLSVSRTKGESSGSSVAAGEKGGNIVSSPQVRKEAGGQLIAATVIQSSTSVPTASSSALTLHTPLGALQLFAPSNFPVGTQMMLEIVGILGNSAAVTDIVDAGDGGRGISGGAGSGNDNRSNNIAVGGSGRASFSGDKGDGGITAMSALQGLVYEQTREGVEGGSGGGNKAQALELQRLADLMKASGLLSGSDVSSALRARMPNILPQVDSRVFASEMILFIMALKGGDIKRWLGAERYMEMSISQSDLLSRLEKSFSVLRAGLSESRQVGGGGSGSQQFMQIAIPIFYGGEIQPVKMLYRHAEREGEKGRKENTDHFVIDIDMSNIGRMQLDCFVTRPVIAEHTGVAGEKAVIGQSAIRSYSFDMAIRSNNSLGDEIEAGIRDIYSTMQEISGFSGSIVFYSGAGACRNYGAVSQGQEEAPSYDAASHVAGLSDSPSAGSGGDIVV